jgi:hypothetical protein
MDAAFADFARNVVKDFGASSLLNVQLVFTKTGVRWHPPLVLESGVRGSIWTGGFILINEDLPTNKQHVCLYHELGHLDYRLNGTPPFDPVEDEFHANYFCLSRLEQEGRLELLRDELDAIQGHIDAGDNRNDHYPAAYQKLWNCSSWNRWVELVKSFRPRGDAK